ncbi:hypothetical protein [Candidatus Karelsulcia muelleri]
MKTKNKITRLIICFYKNDRYGFRDIIIPSDKVSDYLKESL